MKQMLTVDEDLHLSAALESDQLISQKLFADPLTVRNMESIQKRLDAGEPLGADLLAGELASRRNEFKGALAGRDQTAAGVPYLNRRHVDFGAAATLASMREQRGIKGRSDEVHAET